LRNGSSYTNEHYCKDYKLDGLNEFFEGEITLKRSVALWKLLAKSIRQYSYNQGKFFQGEYSYKYYSDYRKNFDAYFLKQLKKHPWIFVDELLCLTNEISLFISP
jgi:hypothetical protein